MFGEVWPSNFIRDRKTDAGAKHLGGIGVAKLVWNDASGDFQRVTNLMQIIAKLTNEGVLGAAPCQESAVRRMRIEETKESQALDNRDYRRIHRDHPFRFEFTKRHVNGPLIGAGRAQAIEGQIGALANAHAGMADEQKDIPSQIVALDELLLQKLILLGGERACKSVRTARDIFATNQAGELRKLFGPSQFDEQGA